MPWTRNSDSILKVEPTGFPDAQPGHVMHTDCHMKGGFELCLTDAHVRSGKNPFHGLAEFSHWEFLSLSG